MDVSKYSQVEYNTTTEKICSYRVKRACQPKSQRVCVTLPTTECTLEAGYICDNKKWEETVRCDETQSNTFTPKKCVPSGFRTLKEIKQVPECRNVTKQVCGSKWEINAEGQKVFASNENCRDKTWEQCELVDRVVEEQVPAISCVDEAFETYLTPIVEEEQTTVTKTGGPEASPTSRLELLGFNTGYRFIERLAKDYPKFKDELDLLKFICKDFWVAVFRLVDAYPIMIPLFKCNHIECKEISFRDDLFHNGP